MGFSMKNQDKTPAPADITTAVDTSFEILVGVAGNASRFQQTATKPIARLCSR